MNKKLSTALLSASVVLPAMAGGLVTNTNQDAAFLRQMSQESIIDITGLYSNPAGTAFLAPGIHLSLNIQNAKQTRTIDTQFSPLFALNTNTPGVDTHRFKGEAYAPVIPSILLSYNMDNKWSFNANFALAGGGGKCEFDQGLGTFEALYASQLYQMVPAAVNAQLSQELPGKLAAGLAQAGVPEPYATMLAGTETHNSQMTGYSLNSYMKGKQYYFGLTLGATYKALDNLALYLGVRTIYATCNYNGWVEDIKANYAYTYDVPANAQLGFPGTNGKGEGEVVLDQYSLSLNADQKGYGFNPIIGADWKINKHWNLAFKYEFKTRFRLKNTSEMNEYTTAAAASNATLGQFADGTKVAADIPSTFMAGVQYSPIKPLRIMAGFHHYGDKNATQYGNKQDKINSNTWEATYGIEYDVTKWFILSASGQTTHYDLSDEYMNDLSFTTCSNSYGFGCRFILSHRCNVDLGYMKTLYSTRDVKTEPAAGIQKNDSYTRTNRVLGLGVNFTF